MSGRSYAQLHQRLQDLIAQGANVAAAEAGTPAAEIHEWMNAVHYCLALIEDKIPTALSDFRHLRNNFEFRVNEDEEPGSSESAYRPDGADVLLDFRFEYIEQANNILKFAATKLEIEGNAYAWTDSANIPESLPPELRGQIASLLAEYTPGGRGPRTDVVKHLVITAVINKAGSSWRSKVGTICTGLDQHGIPAPRCREHDKEAPKDWVSAFHENAERVREAMRKSIPACQRYFPARFAKTFPNLSQSAKNPL